ncbi:MAG: hypothetical protein LBH09_07615 [Peptococcaceae bacterium]|jgi:mRNA-degrading endonuclease RelE of RelBE toxin-antitoxin system|nr:hypothetical protein [Peptococcaceae bacterium]
MKYDVSDAVMKMLGEMDDDTVRPLFSGIMALPDFGDTKELEGVHAGRQRLRVGDWRIIFTSDDDNIQVGYILPPSDADPDTAGSAGITYRHGEAALSDTAVELHRIIDLLDDKLIEVLYNVAVSLAAQMDLSSVSRRDFDAISPDQDREIEIAFNEIRRGHCMSYIPEDEMNDFFESNLARPPINVQITNPDSEIMKNLPQKGEKPVYRRIKRKLSNI